MPSRTQNDKWVPLQQCFGRKDDLPSHPSFNYARGLVAFAFDAAERCATLATRAASGST
jgi:hypothetical protein